MGLNVDRFTVKIIDRAKDEIKYASVSANDGKRAVEEEIEHEFEQAEASEAVEKGVRIFIDWLKSGKLEIQMYESGTVYVGKIKNLYDLLDSGDDKKLLQLIEEGDLWKFNSEEFSASFIRDLGVDLAQLKAWQSVWKRIKVDPKLVEFKRNLTTNPVMKDRKIIVFTESMETAEYLYEALNPLYNGRVVYYSGKSSASHDSTILQYINAPIIESKGA